MRKHRSRGKLINSLCDIWKREHNYHTDMLMLCTGHTASLSAQRRRADGQVEHFSRPQSTFSMGLNGSLHKRETRGNQPPLQHAMAV